MAELDSRAPWWSWRHKSILEISLQASPSILGRASHSCSHWTFLFICPVESDRSSSTFLVGHLKAAHLIRRKEVLCFGTWEVYLDLTMANNTANKHHFKWGRASISLNCFNLKKILIILGQPASFLALLSSQVQNQQRACMQNIVFCWYPKTMRDDGDFKGRKGGFVRHPNIVGMPSLKQWRLKTRSTNTRMCLKIFPIMAINWIGQFMADWGWLEKRSQDRNRSYYDITTLKVGCSSSMKRFQAMGVRIIELLCDELKME